MCSISNAWLGPLLVVIAMLLISAGLMLLKERALALYEKHKHKAEQYSQRLTAMAHGAPAQVAHGHPTWP